MGALTTILGVAGIVSSIAKGIGNAINRKVQATEKEKELNTSLNNLTDSYNLATKQADESYALANSQVNESYILNKNQTEATRDRSLKQSATSQAMQNELYNVQMATLQVEASQAQGSAIQNTAISGFRNTGSAQNVQKNTESAYARQIKSTKLSVDLNKYQSYQSALNNYLDSNAQLERYKMNLKQTLESNDVSYKQNLASMALQYKQNKQAIQEDLDYMGSTEFKVQSVFGYATDIFGSAVDATNSAYQNGLLKL